MTSSARPERVYHQDYIARIRYSNTLPPPPNPPKLLDVPGTGLAGGEYTSAGYASRMAREQPLNIEADAELGMPIDLIGMPGVFEGDERAIMAAEHPKPTHPHDKPLLRPLASLGKPAASTGGVSFLRRTEYIASGATQHFSSSTSKDLLRVRNDPKRKRKPNIDREDPINIIRNIVKGFDIAYPDDAYTGPEDTEHIRGAPPTDADTRAWSQPKHPSNPALELIDSYPLLPDLDAIPTMKGYMVAKFITNPLPPSDTYDERLDTAILRPIADADMLVKQQEQEALRDADPSRPEYMPECNYEYYLPEDARAVRGWKRKLDVTDPSNDDDDLYSDDVSDGRRAFKFTRLRPYETCHQTTYLQTAGGDVYSDTVAIALHDPEADESTKKRLSKGAYYYPVVQKTQLRPQRNMGRMAFSRTEAESVDELQVTVGDMGEDKRAMLQDITGPLESTAAPAVEES